MVLGGVFATLTSAMLVNRRAGQTLQIAANDRDTKRFAALIEASEHMRHALSERVESLETENRDLHRQIALLTAEVGALRAESMECTHLRERVAELERVQEYRSGE